MSRSLADRLTFPNNNNPATALGIAAAVAAAGSSGDELANGALVQSLDRMRAGLVAGVRDPHKVVAGTVLIPALKADEVFQVAALKLLAEFGALDAPWAMIVALQASLGPVVVRALVDAGGLQGQVATTSLRTVRRADVARLLLGAGCDPNAVPAVGGGTALHAWVLRGGSTAAAIVAVLLEGAADVNSATDARDRTPLHTLVASSTVEPAQRVELARLLLDAGGDPTIEDRDGVTPLAAAQARLKASVRHGGVPVEELAASRKLVAMLARAAGWYRRRHVLLAVRGRYGGAVAVATGGDGAAVGAGAAAACGDATAAAL